MKPGLLTGQTIRITLKAIDALGQIIENYFISSSRIAVTDTDDTPYPVSAVTWSNGIGTLTVSVPAELGDKTLLVYVDQVLVTTYPDPLNVTLINPYRGRFDLTNAVIAYDCCVDDDVSEYGQNYANLGTYGFRPSTVGEYLYAPFTDAMQYKTSPAGSLITLGQKKLCIPQVNVQYSGVSIKHFNSSFNDYIDDLLNNVNYATTGLPIRTICLLARYPIPVSGVYQLRPTLHFNWDTVDGSGDGLKISFPGAVSSSYPSYYSFTDLSIHRRDASAGVSNVNTVIHTIATAGGTHWFTDGIALITLTLDDSARDGTAILKIWVNSGLLLHTETLTLSSAAKTEARGLYSRKVAISQGGGSAGANYIPLFELVCYSDVKSQSFIQANAAAWGL